MSFFAGLCVRSFTFSYMPLPPCWGMPHTSRSGSLIVTVERVGEPRRLSRPPTSLRCEPPRPDSPHSCEQPKGAMEPVEVLRDAFASYLARLQEAAGPACVLRFLSTNLRCAHEVIVAPNEGYVERARSFDARTGAYVDSEPEPVKRERVLELLMSCHCDWETTYAFSRMHTSLYRPQHACGAVVERVLCLYEGILKLGHDVGDRDRNQRLLLEDHVPSAIVSRVSAEPLCFFFGRVESLGVGVAPDDLWQWAIASLAGTYRHWVERSHGEAPHPVQDGERLTAVAH